MVTNQKPKKTKRLASKPKRSIIHNNATKFPQKAFQLYVTLLMIVCAGLLINHVWSNRAHQVLGDTTNLSASSLFVDTNAYRTQYHETALSINPDLMKAAQAKANDMVKLNFWSHDTPNGTPPWTFITSAGYQYQSAGENLAYGFISAQSVLSAWMNSPEHRANILDTNYQNVGFGIANATNYQGHGPTTVVVAMYGQPANPNIVLADSATSSNQASGQMAGYSTPMQESVGRIQQLLGNNSSWLEFATLAVTLILLLLLVIRHSIKWRRIIIDGDIFIHKHPWFDFGLTAIMMLGYILSRSAGYIG